MARFRSAAVVGLMLVLSVASLASAAPAPTLPTLVDIRAAHHHGFDRIVFQFEGRLPARTIADWVDRVVHDPSDKPVPVQGNAFIKVVMLDATAHSDTEPFNTTYGPRKRAFALPNIAHVVAAGDFEAVVSFGIGLMHKTRILRTSRLHDPSRFVVDVATTYPKASVGVAFVEPDVVTLSAVSTAETLTLAPRIVPAGDRASGALMRLWAGPTAEELTAGLRFVSSHTKGFRDLHINDRGIARLVLKGRCDGEGQAVTVADEIMATLKPLPGIEWVKIYDSHDQTQHPAGLRDSIPDCLAP